MTNLPHGRRAVTLERVAYGLALKTAARLGGAFKKTESGRQVVIVLRLPTHAELYEYAAAASILVREVEALHEFCVGSPTISRKGGIEYEPINTQLKLGRSLLIVWPSDHEVPREMALVADRVVAVGPVRPFHLVVAAKSFADQTIDLADAKRMMDYPLSEVFAAFRTKRPPAAVLGRLADSKVVETPVVDGPRLEQLVGYGDAKTWGLSLAQDIRAWHDGKLSWSDVDRGLLLSGAPGTGKTMFAGALARSCGAHLVATSIARWQAAGRLDDTLKAMHRSFDEAISHKPSILFIDEFDGISDRARLIGNVHETYWTQVINSLLELIDGHERLDGVVVIGATNHPDVIDAALRRPGRLDRHIRISLPDTEERRQLSRFYFGNDITDEVVEALATATTGLTGAHFAKAGREARRAARRAGRAVSIEDVLAVLPVPKRIAGGERRMVAIHEAGHAVVGVRLGVGELKTVAVPWEVHASQPLGFAHFQFDENPLWDRQEYLDQVAVTLGGRAAEEVILGTAFDGAGAAEGSDLHKASDLATMMEFQLGMGEGLAYFNLKSTEERDRVRQNNPAVAARVERVLRQEMERSREIVTRFRVAVERIADILVEKAIIDGDEVRRIIRETSR
ncbi:ATP-dependent hydrolase [Rhizobium anhuiense]|uniref:ATP-dependent hydrolase n=1 Tax=Rhizobium anhuiense TaxID=1184720 RepID=A0ABX4IW52_9HYPH|nr:AAA family ATPase [Rhizobium anhuiense]PDS43163.1 ATP-dependent hydrolase [Rhizobium anhuiense]PDS45773.1 ATP-dependent hydrolase [Rhizobium anhuiense]